MTESTSITFSSIRPDTIKKNLQKMYYPSSETLYREYQFNIIKTCLHSNTLVCLPTGLGKTMIASIIMFNFHKWFTGKIFFFAPTKPLVNQQKNSFIKLFPSLSNIITEITGMTSRKKRDVLYNEKKIFFLTPQTLDNDLLNHFVNTNMISLLIFDEAHKAQKNYAYSTIVQKIYEQSSQNLLLRIIGLSASPGSSVEAIQNVINSLHITQLEFRTESDSDIVPYIFNKNIKIVEIEMNADINKIEKLMFNLIQNRIKVLEKFHIVDGKLNPKYLSISQLLKYQKNFKDNKEDFEHEIGPCLISEIYQTFSLLFQLLHCKKKLLSEGVESFKEGIKKIDNNSFNANSKSNNMESRAKFKTPGKSGYKKFNNGALVYSTARKNLIESSEFQEIKNELLKSESKQSNNSLDITHPKLRKLKSILSENLTKIINPNSPSKVIIFSDYKDSTLEIFNFLNSQHDLSQIKFSIFTGQAKNFKQKDQLEIMEKFRNGAIHVLIATSVAEEGLDIGEVDLIICYDFNTTSPIKMIQRFGRTGRKRNGTVIVLATKGEEKSKYFRALNRIKNLYSNLRDVNSLYSKIELEKKENTKNLIIPYEWINNVEKFDLEKEINDDISESEFSDDELEDGEDNNNQNRKEMPDQSTKGVSFNFCSPFPVTSQIKNNKKGSILKNSTKANIPNNNINNNYNILSFFTQQKGKKDEKIISNIECNNQEEQKPNSKLLFSFKILPKKTDSGSKYKTCSSCKIPTLNEIPELQFDTSIIENQNKNEDQNEDKNKFHEENIKDLPITINEDELVNIIEEMKDEKSASKIIDSTNKKETNIKEKDNVFDDITITDEIINQLLGNDDKLANHCENSNNKSEDITHDILKVNFSKRKYDEYEKENFNLINSNNMK